MIINHNHSEEANKEVDELSSGMVQAWVAHFVTPLKRR